MSIASEPGWLVALIVRFSSICVSTSLLNAALAQPRKPRARSWRS